MIDVIVGKLLWKLLQITCPLIISSHAWKSHLTWICTLNVKNEFWLAKNTLLSFFVLNSTVNLILLNHRTSSGNWQISFHFSTHHLQNNILLSKLLIQRLWPVFYVDDKIWRLSIKLCKAQYSIFYILFDISISLPFWLCCFKEP